MSWRFQDTTNFADSISRQVSAIVSTYNNYCPLKNKRHIDRKKQYHRLRVFIAAIRKQPGRVDHTPKQIIDNKVLLKLVSVIPDTFDGIAIRCVFLFAKFFGLRMGDYGFDRRSIEFKTWNNIQLFLKQGIYCIRFSTDVGKHNQVHKPEILVWRCTCQLYDPKICLVCYMRRYKRLVNQLLGPINNIPLFIWSNKTPITRTIIYKYLKFYLKRIGLTPSKYLSAHSFRHGCITDLVRAGVPEWLIKKFARHSPKSKMTFHYTQTTANEESDMILDKLTKFNNNNSANQ